ncbi:MAG: methyltransferase [Tannerella sp.]|nr:methyltransferase [Tannerella sp.]
MSNNFFRFKQFIVRQDRCAMKVGVDGVLIGAWAGEQLDDPLRILDVGAGTGLIALMMAQRFENALIDAVEIDEEACNQAKENILESPFKGRIDVYCESITNFKPDYRYDLIVSNPPYFRQSLKCPDNKRTAARHDDSLPLPVLIEYSRKSLSINGLISLIIPTELHESIKGIAEANSLCISRQMDVITVEGNQPKRIMLELSHQNGELLCADNVRSLTLETKDHIKTSQYQELTKHFYL